jgi:hypothetical protein
VISERFPLAHIGERDPAARQDCTPQSAAIGR